MLFSSETLSYMETVHLDKNFNKLSFYVQQDTCAQHT